MKNYVLHTYFSCATIFPFLVHCVQQQLYSKWIKSYKTYCIHFVSEIKISWFVVMGSPTTAQQYSLFNMHQNRTKNITPNGLFVKPILRKLWNCRWGSSLWLKKLRIWCHILYTKFDEMCSTHLFFYLSRNLLLLKL